MDRGIIKAAIRVQLLSVHMLFRGVPNPGSAANGSVERIMACLSE